MYHDLSFFPKNRSDTQLLNFLKLFKPFLLTPSFWNFEALFVSPNSLYIYSIFKQILPQTSDLLYAQKQTLKLYFLLLCTPPPPHKRSLLVSCSVSVVVIQSTVQHIANLQISPDFQAHQKKIWRGSIIGWLWSSSSSTELGTRTNMSAMVWYCVLLPW